MELLQPDWTDVLSELVANNPSHSQQEADCGGWAASLRQQQQGWSKALRHVENLKCGTMTFTGSWVNKPTSDWTQVPVHDSPSNPRLFEPPRGDLQQSPLRKCWWRAQPSPSLNISLPVLFPECRKGDIKWKGPWWWAPHDIQLMWKDPDEDFTWQPKLEATSEVHFGSLFRVGHHILEEKIMRYSSAKQCHHKV